MARYLFLWPVCAAGLMMAGGYLPTRALAGQAGLEAMLLAQALVVAVVYATLIPAMRQMVHADAAGRLRLALRAGTIRFVATVLLAAGMAWRRVVEPTGFLVWVAVAYVVMIKVETLTLVRWSKRLEKPR